MRPKALISRLGFTVLEVVIVLAVVAVAIALLLPVFSSAKRAVKSVSCLSNLHQLGSAINLYENDADGCLPPFNPPRFAPSKNLVIDPLRKYGVTDELYHCPDYSGPTRQAHQIDYDIRDAIEVNSSATPVIQVWRIDPDENSILAFCQWNTSHPTFALSNGKGGSIANGHLNALKSDASVHKVPTAKIKVHEENWKPFPSATNPDEYRWYEFPGETFPPKLVKMP